MLEEQFVEELLKVCVIVRGDLFECVQCGTEWNPLEYTWIPGEEWYHCPGGCNRNKVLVNANTGNGGET